MSLGDAGFSFFHTGLNFGMGFEMHMEKRIYSNKRIICNMVLAPLSYYLIMQIVAMGASVYVTTRLAMEGLSEAELAAQTTERIYQYNVQLTMASALIALPIVFFLFYRRQEKLRRRGNPAGLLLMLPFGMAACLTVNMLISLSRLSEFFPGYDELAETIFQGNIWLELIGVAVMPALIEELIYRGVIYRGFRRFVKPVWAALLSALVFGIMHMNVVQFVYAFLLGLLLAWVYEAYRSILAPMLMHLAANAFSVLLTEWEPLGKALETAAGTWTMLGLMLLCDIAIPIYLCKKRK